MTPQEMATSRKATFDNLYDAFYAYFVAKLRADSSKFAKYRLQLLTVYWEDVELTRIVYPLFETMSCTLAEKQAVARAALYDALVAHSFSGHLAATSTALFARLDDEEKRVNDALTTLSARIRNLQDQAVPLAVVQSVENSLKKQIEEVGQYAAGIFDTLKSKEPKVNAIPKRQQVRTRPQIGKQE